MRNRVGTLFKLGVSLNNHTKARIFDKIPTLPENQQSKIACYTIDLIQESMREFMKSGFELQKRTTPKYVEAAKQFQKACECADTLETLDEPTTVDKKELAGVYAQFASSLKRHAPHLASKEEMVKKALALDPTNPIANDLKVDMQLDSYLSHSKSSR